MTLEAGTQLAYDVTAQLGDYVFRLGYNAETGVSVNTGDTPIEWGQVFSGICWYNYVDTNGSSRKETAAFTFSNSVSDGYAFVTGEHVQALAHRTKNSSGSVPRLTISTDGACHFFGADYFTIDLNCDGISNTKTYNYLKVDRSGTSPVNTFYSGSVPTLSYDSSLGFCLIGRTENVNFSTNSRITNNFPTSVVLPISGQTYTFNDVRSQVIEYINVNFLEDGVEIDPENVPTWEQITEPTEPTESTEPTEPPTGGEGFVFDYSEVVSPSELVDILSDETYDLETVDDRGLLTAETLPQLPDATFSADGLSLIVDTVTVGKSFLESLGLWVPLVATAVVVVLIRILK